MSSYLDLTYNNLGDVDIIMDPYLRRTWARIDLDAIDYNYSQIRQHIDKKSKILCVVKADAYGHGATVLAKEYENLGADFLGVSNLEEAIQIREAGVSLPILILGYTPPHLACLLSKYNISQTVVSLEHAQELNKNAAEQDISINIHIKIDTGMNRLGLVVNNLSDSDTVATTIKDISKLHNLSIEGMFTHFAVADEGDDGREFTLKQYELFTAVINRSKERGVNIPICHCCNSGAILDYPEFSLDMVRPGIILYGLLPSNKCKTKLDLVPAMELKAIVSMVKYANEASSVSYGRTFNVNKANMKIATVPIGYADGYKRSLSSKAYMSVCKKKAPVIGRVCMDQTMLDVTNIDGVTEGSVVTIFGRNCDNKIIVDELATISGTINYEFICLLGKRVPRIYYKNDKAVATLNYILPNNS